MSSDAVISKKIKTYMKRLLIEYKKQDVNLFNILRELGENDIKISTDTELDFGGEHHGHTLIFLFPEKCFEANITLSNQETLSERLKDSLNQVITESNESIQEVKFELKNENDSEPIDFTKYLKNKIELKNITFWKPDYLRAFISHSEKNYEIANKMKIQLEDFGISCFVAHKDIEPTKEWKEEIKTALNSMEVMLMLVTEDSCKSWWVNQEIGFALCQNIPIIPVKLDKHDPKGFISEIQAITLNKNQIISKQHDTIKKLVDCIKNTLPEHPFFKKNLLKIFFNARSACFHGAKEAFMNIIDLKFNDQEIEKIVNKITDETKKSEGNFGGLNQLQAILMDDIIPKHSQKISKKYKYYAELLEDKILSQHTQKRYSVKKLDEWKFEIIDHHQTPANQKIDKVNLEDIPF